jgi:hypothetical protein
MIPQSPPPSSGRGFRWISLMVPSPLVGEGKGEGAWILGENPVRRHQKIFMTMILRQKSIHFECHSGLDPESSVLNLDSCWSLPRTSIRGRNDGPGTYTKKRWRHHIIAFVSIFVLAGFILTIPVVAIGQTNERTTLSQESGRNPFLLPPGVHLLSKIGATSGRTNSLPGDIPSRSFMLTAILISDHARLALIDRHIVTVGDSVHGEKVLEIMTDRVILGKGEQKKTLLLSQSPVRLTVEQSPPPNPPAEKGGRTSLEIPVASTRNRAARQTSLEGPTPPAGQAGVISNGVKEEVKGEDR